MSRKEHRGPEVGTRLCLRKIRTASVAGEGRVKERMSEMRTQSQPGGFVARGKSLLFFFFLLHMQ